MLFELSGLAKVINIQPVSEGFTKVQLLGSESRKTKKGILDLSGARWVNLNGALADSWAANAEKLKNSIVHINATGSTDNNNGTFFENYRVTNINVAVWANHAQHIKTKLMTLSGMGRVIGISKKTDNLTTLKVISSRDFNGKKVTVTRFINLNGKAAQWWAERQNTLLKTLIIFKAEVTSNKTGTGDNVKYYDNYSMFEFPTIVPNSGSQQASTQQNQMPSQTNYDQQMADQMMHDQMMHEQQMANQMMDDFGFPMPNEMDHDYDAYEQYAQQQTA